MGYSGINGRALVHEDDLFDHRSLICKLVHNWIGSSGLTSAYFALYVLWARTISMAAILCYLLTHSCVAFSSLASASSIALSIQIDSDSRWEDDTGILFRGQTASQPAMESRNQLCLITNVPPICIYATAASFADRETGLSTKYGCEGYSLLQRNIIICNCPSGSLGGGLSSRTKRLTTVQSFYCAPIKLACWAFVKMNANCSGPHRQSTTGL